MRLSIDVSSITENNVCTSRTFREGIAVRKTAMNCYMWGLTVCVIARVEMKGWKRSAFYVGDFGYSRVWRTSKECVYRRFRPSEEEKLSFFHLNCTELGWFVCEMVWWNNSRSIRSGPYRKTMHELISKYERVCFKKYDKEWVEVRDIFAK